MARRKGSLTRNSGTWTEARFFNFIKGALRQASNRWPPKYKVKTEARVERGKYKCAGYNREAHIVDASLPPIKGNKRRINNAVVDHIEPVVPLTGFISWDDIIERMFCEVDGLQVLCYDCHNKKTREERQKRNASC